MIRTRYIGRLSTLKVFPATQIAQRSISLPSSRTQSSKIELPEASKPSTSDGPTTDAYTIAERTLKLLAKRNVPAIMRLIKLNQDLDLTVTWNYLIQYYLENGSINLAVNAYSLMKKNGHFPNAHTYTTLFDGLSSKYESGGRDRLTWTVSKLLEDKRVQPSVIHLNAVLQVCAKMKDLKLAYEYLDDFRIAGVDELDTRTFDILFKLFRSLVHAEERPGLKRLRVPYREVTPVARQLLDDTMRMWYDVETRWRTGHLTVDSRLLYSFVSVPEKGGFEDVNRALAAICLMCDLPFHESSKTADTKINAGKQKQGNRVELIPPLQTIMLVLAESLDDPEIVDHYWKLIKTLFADDMTTSTYEARIRSLKGAGQPDEALAVLAEMQQKNIEIRPGTIFLTLLTSMTRDSEQDLRRANKMMKTFVADMGITKLMTLTVTTTYCRFIALGRDMNDISTAVKIIDQVDWKRLAEDCQDVPHNKQRLRETIHHMARRTTYWLLDAKGNTNLVILIKGLSRRLRAVQREYYPDDYAAHIEARQVRIQQLSMEAKNTAARSP